LITKGEVHLVAKSKSEIIVGEAQVNTTIHIDHTQASSELRKRTQMQMEMNFSGNRSVPLDVFLGKIGRGYALSCWD
jgi:hypothetical protein